MEVSEKIYAPTPLRDASLVHRAPGPYGHQLITLPVTISSIFLCLTIARRNREKEISELDGRIQINEEEMCENETILS